jgi:hypothetical protein
MRLRGRDELNTEAGEGLRGLDRPARCQAHDAELGTSFWGQQYHATADRTGLTLSVCQTGITKRKPLSNAELEISVLDLFNDLRELVHIASHTKEDVRTLIPSEHRDRNA